jgi:hypothetical protein
MEGLPILSISTATATQRKHWQILNWGQGLVGQLVLTDPTAAAFGLSLTLALENI